MICVKKIYQARVSIASAAPHDNTPLIKRILQLRKEKAQLLGFPNHAALVLSTKMAGDAVQVRQLLDELHRVGYQRSIAEHEQLSAYAAEHGGPEKLEPWDIPYWERAMEEAQFRIDTEKLRRYLPFPHVLQETFALLGKLFGISVEETTADVQVWHPDVKFYQVYDTNNKHIASFYLDPYSRPQNKSEGAWVSPCNDRSLINGKLQIPLCIVVAGFAPPIGNEPALLSFDDVQYLLHELGHAVHVMLTMVDYGEVAGLNGVELDAIEMPSGLMENFLDIDIIVKDISRHIDSDKPLPPHLLAQLHTAKNFRAASSLQRQLFLSYLDLQLHDDFDPDTQDLFALVHEIASKTLPAPLRADSRFLNSFEHIFSIGYDVNYYGYMWGELLAADAFELFKENGFDDEGLRRSGRKFRDTVLAVGGSKPARDIFIELRGRLPSAQALLKSYGLVE